MEKVINLSKSQQVIKRIFDIVLAIILLVLTLWFQIVLVIVATFDTKKFGIFTQERIGQFGRVFNVIKIRTMIPDLNIKTNITTNLDPRITKFGSFLRKSKLDELPLIFNILIGQMSFVGPRPDVPGYADKLEGVNRSILNLKPGITGPATLKYLREEVLLAKQKDPQKYNDEVIYPEKTRINLEYIKHYSFLLDLKCIYRTIFRKEWN